MTEKNNHSINVKSTASGHNLLGTRRLTMEDGSDLTIVTDYMGFAIKNEFWEEFLRDVARDFGKLTDEDIDAINDQLMTPEQRKMVYG